jgi:hypothetical protein
MKAELVNDDDHSQLNVLQSFSEYHDIELNNSENEINIGNDMSQIFGITQYNPEDF